MSGTLQTQFGNASHGDGNIRRSYAIWSRLWRGNSVVIVLALLAGIGYGAHMLIRYVKIRRDSASRASTVVHPSAEDGSVQEIGYVHSMRNELFLRDDNSMNLVWFIKVPATGHLYSCAYEKGFPSFRTGNDVRLIRPQDDGSEAGLGYVVGLHENLIGKAALVWVVDEEDLKSTIEPDEPDYYP